MKSFLFGLILGAAGAVAGLHYCDLAHVDMIHGLLGLDAVEAEEEVILMEQVDEDADEAEAADGDAVDGDAAEAAEDMVDDAEEAVEEAVEEVVEEAEEAVEEAVEDVATP